MTATQLSPVEFKASSIPTQFNVATYFVDRNVARGRGDKIAIECGEERVTYHQVLERVNRFGNALRDALGVRLEERVLLLLLDCPEYAYSFFGAIKVGAVPIPTSTLFKPADYEYILNDSRARVVVVSEALLPLLQAIPRERLRYLRQVVVVGNAPAGTLAFDELLAAASPELEAEPTSKDDTACWASPSRIAASAWPSCSSPTAWATRSTSRSAWAPRPSCSRGRPRRPTSSTSSTATGRRCSSRCRPTTPCSWPTRPSATSRRCAGASR